MLLELKQGPRITKEHADKAQQYVDIKQRAVGMLDACMRRISEVCVFVE